MEVDLNLIRRGLKKILQAQSNSEARATADILLSYMDSQEGKMVDTEPEVPMVRTFSDSDTFTAKMLNEPSDKITVIKELRSAFNFGLKEAKDFTEGQPWNQVSKDNLIKLQKIAQNLGLRVEVTTNHNEHLF